MTDGPISNAWLIAALWAVTMALAGFLGRALYQKVCEIAEATTDLAKSHARLEERHDGTQRRIDIIERQNADIFARLDRINERQASMEATGPIGVRRHRLHPDD